MDFDTTLGMEPDYAGAGHPSFFQNPVMDQKMLDNIDNAKITDPASLWKKQTSLKKGENERSFYTIPFDPLDPPFSKQELQQFVTKLDPITSVTGNNVTPTLLFHFFFSKQNITNMQKNIRYSVNKWSGFNVGDQSLIQLMIIMEGIFNSKARHLDESSAPSRMLLEHIYGEISRLNELVLQEVVPIVVNQVEQHVSYMKRVDNPVSSASLQRPMDTKITGTKVFRASTDILALGSNF